jgi:hypothetical protein
MYSDFYEQMSKSYSSIHFWPQPYNYSQWFQGLSPEYQAYYMHPDSYTVNYSEAIRKYS